MTTESEPPSEGDVLKTINKTSIINEVDKADKIPNASILSTK